MKLTRDARRGDLRYVARDYQIAKLLRDVMISKDIVLILCSCSTQTCYTRHNTYHAALTSRYLCLLGFNNLVVVYSTDYLLLITQ